MKKSCVWGAGLVRIRLPLPLDRNSLAIDVNEHLIMNTSVVPCKKETTMIEMVCAYYSRLKSFSGFLIFMFCLITLFGMSSRTHADALLILPLDEGGGTVAGDSSGMGNDGTLVGGAAYVANTGDGSAYALQLDGVDDYIDLGTVDVAGSGVSLAVWFKADSYPGSARDPRLISKATGTAANDHVFMLSTIASGSATRLRARVRVGGTTTTLIASSGDLVTGVWQHGALIYDGSALRLYLNSLEVGSTPLSGVVDVDPGMGVAAGSQPGGTTRFFDGVLDDVRIVQRALSPVELLALATGNGQPIALDDSYTVDEDSSLSVDAVAGVLGNDTDPENDTLQATRVDDVSHGSLVLNPDGSFDYTPAANYVGMDSFTYRARDGSADSNLATVTLTVGAVSDAPVAVDDSYQTIPNQPLSIAAIGGLLTNDTDVDSALLQVRLVDDVTQGNLTLNLDGSFDYIPNVDYSGSDSFTYVANDGALDSNLATVNISILVPPTALDDSYNVDEDVLLVVPAITGVLANDGDTSPPDDLTALLVTGPTHGSLTELGLDGHFSYVPEADYYGEDSFVYRASDGVNGTSAEATVTLTVLPVNDAPVAVDDTYQTPMNTLLPVDAANGVLANDTDAEGDALQSLVLVGNVSHGSLVLNPDGSFDYTPAADYTGTDSFSYQANDGLLNSSPATVTISISIVENEPPQIQTGRITFSKQTIDTTVDETHYTAGTDLDGDEDIDLIATDFVGDSVYWYRNDGSGGFEKIILDNNLDGAYPAHLGDVDGDGDVDILAGGYDGDTIAWYVNDGLGGFTKKVLDAAADGIHSIETVDLDEDGDVDLLTSNQDAGTVAWYENDGSNVFSIHVIDATTSVVKRAVFADFDDDGDIDVASASDSGSGVAWYENDGSENFTRRDVDSDVRGSYFIIPVDLNGDTFIDLLSASRRGNKIAWFRNDGAGNFVKQTIDADVQAPRSVFAADVDGDGDMDALAASVDDDRIAWYENESDGNFTKHVVDQTAAGAYGVYAVDVDGDSDVDILSASRDDDSVSVHLHTREHHAAVPIGGNLVIDGSMLLTTDPNDGPGAITYTLKSVPGFGELRLDGASLSVGATFTQADVNLSRITYVHYGSNSTTDIFEFAVEDGGENGVKPRGSAFLISVIDPADFLVQLSFDEGSGTVATDSTGKGNEGILINGPVYEAGTADGSAFALHFDGADDYVDLGTLDLAGSGLTLAAWFNADTFPGSARDPRLISKATGVSANDHVFMLSTIAVGSETRLRGRVRVGGTTTTLVAATGNLAVGVWHHAALTHDGNTLRLYLDGAEVGSIPLVGAVDTDPAVLVTVGNQPPGAGARYFDGLIDDVRLLQRVLLDEEIADIFASVLLSSVPSTPRGLTIFAISSSQANLFGDVSVDNTGVTGHESHRRDLILVATVDGVFWSDTGMSGNVNHSNCTRLSQLSTRKKPNLLNSLTSGYQGLHYKRPVIPSKLCSTESSVAAVAAVPA